MLRWIGFLVVAIVLANVLGHVPIVGGVFRRSGIFGIWFTALGLAWLVSWLGSRAVVGRRAKNQIRELGAVDTPHMRGKLGALHLAAGRWGKAKPLLEEAAAGEPDVAEWRYRLGLAHFKSGELDQGRAALESVVATDPEYAYGSAQMRLAEVAHKSGDAERALAALAIFERNHGPSPESAYRRGRAHASLGQKAEAAAALESVGPLVSQVANYQRTSSFRWIAAAWRTRLFGA